MFAIYQAWSSTARFHQASLKTHTRHSRTAQIFKKTAEGFTKAIESILPEATVLMAKLPPEYTTWTGKQILDYCEISGKEFKV